MSLTHAGSEEDSLPTANGVSFGVGQSATLLGPCLDPYRFVKDILIPSSIE